MWTRVSNHIPTIFDHIWVCIWSLSLITYDTIYDIKTNHMPKCLQTICQIIYDFKTICDLYSDHIWLKSNHIWYYVKSYMILNHIWYHIWCWNKSYVKSYTTQIICGIIYAQSYTTKSYMVPLMIHHMVSYTCLSNHIYVPYVALIYDLSYMKSYVKSYMNMWIKSYVKSYECRTYQNVCINYVYIHPNPNAISCPEP